MIQEIFDNDIISRWVFFPIHIEINGVLNFKSTFQFNSAHDCCESVNCNRLLSDECDLHQMGCNKAKEDNKKTSGRVPKEYKGYITAQVEEIKKLNSESFKFEVFHEPIENNYAHCHLKLILNSTGKAVKNLAKEKLKDCFSRLIPSNFI